MPAGEVSNCWQLQTKRACTAVLVSPAVGSKSLSSFVLLLDIHITLAFLGVNPGCSRQITPLSIFLEQPAWSPQLRELS